MHRQVDPEVVAGFLAEARSYLPAIQLGSADAAQPPEEAYRLVHTIKGGGAMVGLDALSDIAGCLEAALEQLMVEENAEIRTFVHQGMPWLETALDGLSAGRVDPRLVDEVHEAFGRIFSLLRHDIIAGPDESNAPGAEATAEPEEVPPELREVFLMEAGDHLRTITALLPGLQEPQPRPAVVQDIRRSVHTLKGAAAMVGFQEITRLAHRMEDYLDVVSEGARSIEPAPVRLLYESTDALENLAAGHKIPAVLGDLYRRYDGLLATAPAVKEVPAAAESTAKPAPAAAIEESADEQTAAPGAAQFVRVPIRQLDSLVNLVSDLVIIRSTFEQRMQEFQRLVAELQPTARRLKNAAYKLETQYEASSLGGGPLPTPPPGKGHSNGGAGNGAPGPVNRLPATFRTHGFDELEFDRYTEFHLLSRDLAETTADIQTVAGELGHIIGDFEGYLTRQARLVTEIEDRLMRTRMVPLATLATRLHRAVRTTAQQLGKEVELVIEGEATGLDKTVLEQMADPLVHLLRNAVDHGIESPDVRRAHRKPARGTIRLSAAHEGNQVALRLSDDGGGIDVEQVRQTAVRRGLLDAAGADRLEADELWELVFLPGFTTVPSVSEISGRGIGLDIVQSQVRKLKGSVTVQSEPGVGTTFSIRLPLTLALTRALLVEANQQTFALPLDAIRQLTRIHRSDLEISGEKLQLRVGDHFYPAIRLGEVLNLPQPTAEIERPPVVLLNTGTSTVALLVDRIIGGREIVIKSLGSHLRHVHGVWGATVLGDGSVVLILNPPELVRDAGPRRMLATPMVPTAPAGLGSYTILVVDDSPSVRRVLTTLLKRAGWNVLLAKDGLDALEVLHHTARPPDLILLDVEMPRMDGFELLATLRGEESYRAIPVVMVTSRAGEKHRHKALELGAKGYVIKPYQDEALLQFVRQKIQQSQPAVRS
ncbi:hypothetical protein AYO44_03325 [Planctomycetaceae bacterium SCGC AG-212-F19]|nr:hypothetical protein AYO44_03325 [Planctomycetaceae bacterium SCGC AG-212-F19]